MSKRQYPVMELPHKLDIAISPTPEARYVPTTRGFEIWCTPEDHPAGWDNVEMIAGPYAQPCAYVGIATWKWLDNQIVGVELETDAYDLNTRDSTGKHAKPMRLYHNRPDDLAWASKKITWLFQEAGLPAPDISLEE